VGVPLITPVVVFNVRPGGSEGVTLKEVTFPFTVGFKGTIGEFKVKLFVAAYPKFDGGALTPSTVILSNLLFPVAP